MNILEEIIEHKRREIETPGYFSALEKVLEHIPHISEKHVCGNISATPEKPNFITTLKSAPVGLIAEVKQRSPSAGPIREPFNAAEIAHSYETAGAQAISCLMDKKYFGGGEKQWNEARSATSLPMLYKEFVIDARQIFHAEALGASAVLLIVAALNDSDLTRFICTIKASGMVPLVEVHTADEMRCAVDAGATCIGINNRDLKTFETKIETTLELCNLAPTGCTLISESGIRTCQDIKTLYDAGISAILVGESLLRQPDLQEAVKSLMYF
jgi:indole-3-glycerol phosphate synthase